MGTSSDYSGKKGGSWSRLKRAATDYAKSGSSTHGRRALARHVETLGGASAAAGGASAGRSAGQRLAGLAAGVGTDGLTSTLQERELGHLVGGDRFVVLSELIDYIAGPGNDQEAAAARDAACDTIERMFGDADDYDDLEAVQLDESDLIELLRGFLTDYQFNRAADIIHERLLRFAPSEIAERERELRELIATSIELRLSEQDPLSIDWDGDQGGAILNEALQSAYRVIEAGEDQ